MALQPIRYEFEDPMQSFVQSFNMVQGLRQQQAQRARQEALQQALQSAARDPSPENLAQIHLQFPELKEQVDAYKTTLGDADKNTLTSAAREAITYGQTGNPDKIAGVFERYAAAAENSGRRDLAQQFKDAAEVAKTNPEAALLTAKFFFNGIDPDGYKNVIAAKDPALDTTIIKNLIAEGLQPGTPEFQQALRDDRRKVSFFHPDYGFVSGTPEYVQSIFGGAPPAGATEIPRVTSKAQADALPPNTEFIGPDNKRYRTPAAKGGGTGNGVGGF